MRNSNRVEVPALGPKQDSLGDMVDHAQLVYFMSQLCLYFKENKRAKVTCSSA